MKINSVIPTPQGSITLGIATVIMTYAIYDRALPDAATMGATNANDLNIEAGRKKATLTAAGMLAAITLLTRDVNVFILGGTALFAFDFHARHANASNPDTGILVSDSGYSTQLRSVS